jgi:hypothetical protein
MNNYELRAELRDDLFEVTRFVSGNDSEAQLDAIGTILDLAMRSTVWSKGEISLTNTDTQEVVATMGAKV